MPIGTNRVFAQDFLLTSLQGDLMIKNGDFVIGISDEQHQRDIISNPSGWWHLSPYVGVGLIFYQDGNINTSTLASIIMNQLSKDGYYTRRPNIIINANGELNITTDCYRVSL